VLNNNLVSKPSISDFQKLEVNFVSLSDMISFVIPCSLNISFMNTWAISISLQVDLIGMKWADLLNLSITTIMASFCLVDVGNPVMKSMEMVSHFHSGMGKGCNNPVGCQCFALTCCHSMHLAKYSAMSFFIPSQ
jgi:hypothetical protein